MLSRALLALVFVGFLSTPAFAQDYPVKPVKFVVPYAPGGTGDLLARIFAEKMQARLGQPFIVENRAGANGNIGMESVSRAPGDGYTVLFTPSEPLVINRTLYAPLSFDADGFVPISVLASTPLVLLVHPKVGVDNVAQLIAFAKANPERLNYSSQGKGSTAHLTAELFGSMAGVKLVHIPYQGGGPALAALLAGQVDMMFVVLSSALPHIRTGKVKVLAVGSEQRNAALPEVPAMSSILPGFASSNWFGMVAPAGTPQAIAARLSAVGLEILKQPDVAKRLFDLSLDTIGSAPVDMGLSLKQDTERWARVIRITGAASN
jgi:tripartite-type tricarboxylate transporter receptor subunit TctC